MTRRLVAPSMIYAFIIYHFIWGKRDKVKRNVFINQIEEGGLEMVDLESKFQSLINIIILYTNVYLTYIPDACIVRFHWYKYLF